MPFFDLLLNAALCSALPRRPQKTNISLKKHKLPHILIWRFCSKLAVKTAHSHCLMTAGSGHMHYSTDWLGLTCVFALAILFPLGVTSALRRPSLQLYNCNHSWTLENNCLDIWELLICLLLCVHLRQCENIDKHFGLCGRLRNPHCSMHHRSIFRSEYKRHKLLQTNTSYCINMNWFTSWIPFASTILILDIWG